MPIVVPPTAPSGGYGVPTDGTYANSNWVEVHHPSHRYEGNVWITNGLVGLYLQNGASNVALAYLWSQQLSTPAWQQIGTLRYKDNSNNIGTLSGIRVDRLGQEDVRITTLSATSAGNSAEVALRLLRGMDYVRCDFRPLTQANTNANGLEFVAAATPKVVFNSGAILDPSTQGASNLSVPADYGYAAGYVASSSWPFICGLLDLNAPNTALPSVISAGSMGIGDTASPAQRQAGVYALFAVPYANPQNLQSNASTGALGTGWSATADTIGGNAVTVAKAASGTASGNADLFGTAASPTTGTYDMWALLKVTSAAGSTPEMQIGVWDATAGSFSSSTTLRANQAGTSYGWVRVATGVSLPAAHNTQFRAVTAATLGTDWFIYEAALVPKTLTGSRGPQDQWQQFLGSSIVRRRVLN